MPGGTGRNGKPDRRLRDANGSFGSRFRSAGHKPNAWMAEKRAKDPRRDICLRHNSFFSWRPKMGNRSYLYITSRPDAPEDRREIAEANNNIPRLWHVLLASGQVAAPIADQRVFADAGTPNFAADAGIALARFRLLAEALQQHPLIDTLPALPRHLRAIAAFLEQCLDEHEAPGRRFFSANLDQYSWLFDMPPEEFVVRQQHDFDATWAAIEQAIAGHDSFALETALGMAGDEAFANWDNWCWSFGLGGFGDYHDYFRNCDDEPRDEEFADFVPQPDPWEIARENDLGLNRQRYAENGLAGVRQVDDDDQPGQILLPAEYEDIWPADENPREELWIRREQLIGLLHLDADGSATTLFEPCLEETWHFSGDLAVVQQNGKMGMLRRDGSWFLPPSFDELWDYAEGYASAREGELIGYLDRRGEWAIPPRFDAVGDFNAAGLAAVTEAGRDGLLRSDGSYAAAPLYDELDWDEELAAWRIRQGDRHGLLQADGSPCLAAEWDEIGCPDERAAIIVVRRGEHYGVFDRAGRQCLPCRYRDVQLRTHNLDDQPPPPAAATQFAVGTESGRGLVDGSGHELIPCRFDDIDELAAQWHDGEVCRSRELLLVQEAGEPPQVGVWNLKTGRQCVPCAYLAIAPFYVDPAGPPLLLVVPAGETPPAASPFGVLDADGRSLIPAEYRWLVEDHGSSADSALEHTRYALTRVFRSKEAFLAQPMNDDEVVWLMPDGRRFGFVDKLAADYAAGDNAAALRLGRALRDGDGIPDDDEQAIVWLERAASGADHPGRPAAMAELAMLLGEDQDPASQARARQLLEQALAEGGDWPTASARNWLGHMQLNGLGGPSDYAAACHQFRLAAEQGNPYADYNLGLCLENGWGMARNPQQAMHRFQKAEQHGVADAAHRAGLLLEQLAHGKPERKRQRELEKAAACQRREIANPNSASIGESCAALARLLQDSGVPPGSPDELPATLEKGAHAGNEECRQKLLALLEKPDSPWQDASRAAHWQEQDAAPPEQRAAPAAKIRPPRWLPYFMLLMIVLLLYRCAGT